MTWTDVMNILAKNSLFGLQYFTLFISNFSQVTYKER